MFNHCRNARSQGFRDAWKKGKVHGVPIAASKTGDVLQMPVAAGSQKLAGFGMLLHP